MEKKKKRKLKTDIFNFTNIFFQCNILCDSPLKHTANGQNPRQMKGMTLIGATGSVQQFTVEQIRWETPGSWCSCRCSLTRKTVTPNPQTDTQIRFRLGQI